MARDGTKTGGRVKGTANKKTREIADKAAAEGITPLEYMLEIMRKPMPPEIEDKLKNSDEPLNVEILAGLVNWHSLRFEAAKFAAPYMHPRLSATTVSGELEHKGNITHTVKDEMQFSLIKDKRKVIDVERKH
jgi:hypothetical protein